MQTDQPNKSEYDGHCAFAVSTGKLEVAGSPSHALESNGRTFVFKNGAARFLWRLLPDRSAKADQVWAAAGHPTTGDRPG